ncbi:MAG: SDR family oxidoreductase [Gammaproteobacteria bacterium]|nr:SDR family oxidoreductase [Gammaproteobacteria bacterium]MCP4879889.1 SDR family oxidoreductase [Gammaproteobacteria bacterium]MDP6165428.1 SDR family oxidoreductase [Gammaproteobacteria bacterium]
MSKQQLLDLTGRAALITGGNQGIGLAIAQCLAKHGAEIHIFDVSDPGPLRDPCFTYYQLDLCDSQAVNTAVATLPAHTTLLVNNAGITRDRSIAKMSDDEWSSVLEVNLSGAFKTLRALTGHMKSAGHGRVVNITSINGLRGKFGQANYAAAKAGLIGLTKTAARELGPKGITVNAVAPGMVMTAMAQQLPQQFIDKARDEALLPDLALPEDIANAVLFLLSEGARLITGEVIRVDSGQYL